MQHPVGALRGQAYALLFPVPVLTGGSADVMVGGAPATWKPRAEKGSQEQPRPLTQGLFRITWATAF